METTESLETMKVLVQDVFHDTPGKFRPTAWYDERQDQIEVRIRGCSTTEDYVGDGIHMLVDNYASGERPALVGFAIDRARAFCEEHGLLSSEGVHLNALFGAISQTNHSLAEKVMSVARSFIEADPDELLIEMS